MIYIIIPVAPQEIYLLIFYVYILYIWTNYGGDLLTTSSHNVLCYQFDVHVVTALRLFKIMYLYVPALCTSTFIMQRYQIFIGT